VRHLHRVHRQLRGLCAVSQCRKTAIPFSAQLPSWRCYVVASYRGCRHLYDQADGVHEDFRLVERDWYLVGAVVV
ncbi:MAG: hypothetical protein ACK559_28435, partial [bacterium]